MRCPSCQVDNDKETTRCRACGAALARKPRRRAGTQIDTISPFAIPVEPVNWPCTRAYWVVCAGLVPGLGLLLGPLAVVLGLVGRAHAKAEPECMVAGQATAAILFGSLITLTNWLGLGLMILGWRDAVP